MDRRERIQSLQVVRALGFLGVFIAHCGVTHVETGPWGVSLFFVLSGFVMVYTYYDRELPASWIQCIKFSAEKIRRLYPLHILMVFFALIIPQNALVRGGGAF